MSRLRRTSLFRALYPNPFSHTALYFLLMLPTILTFCSVQNSPHLLPPTAILHSHLVPQLTSTQSQLNAKLQTVQSQNSSLATIIQTQREEIESLLAGLEQSMADLEGAGQKLGAEEGVGGLRTVIRDMDAEMSG